MAAGLIGRERQGRANRRTREDGGVKRPTASLVASLLAVAVLGAACTSDPPDDTTKTPAAAEQMQAFFASYEVLSGQPNRIEVGLMRSDQRSLSYGTVQFRFSYLGTQDNPSAAQAGPTATAKFLLVPGMQASSQPKPTFTLPTVARGVYEAQNVTLDKPGFWNVEVVANLADGSTQSAASKFAAVAKPSYPAPGEPALKTQNDTMSSKGVAASAIDSRALTGGTGAIPDPELHQTTIADAIKQHEPAFVLFSTPVYCISKFCGPVTDSIEQLAKQYSDKAVFIHVEIYKQYSDQKKVINKAAADWVYRNGDVTEPWLFEIGSDGKIVDRWQNLIDLQEVQQALQKLPAMR
jgi:hypothetical protein